MPEFFPDITTDEYADQLDAKFDAIEVPHDPEIPNGILINVDKFVASDAASGEGHGPTIRIVDRTGKPLSLEVSAIRLSGGYVLNVYDIEEGRLAQVNIITGKRDDVAVQSIRIVNSDVETKKIAV